MQNSIKSLGDKFVFKKNIKVLAIMSIFSGVSMSMFLAIWQPFAISLGASVTLLGFFQSLGGSHGIISSVSKPIGGWASDRLGRKPFVILAPVFSISMFLAFILAGVTENLLLLTLGVIFFGLGGLTWGAWSSILAESIERERLGIGYSMMNFFNSVPGVALPVVSGYLAGKLGFTSVFLISIAFESMYLGVAYFLLRETVHRSDKILSIGGGFKKSLGEIFTPTSGLKFFHFVTALNTFSWGLGSAILYGMLVKTYGFSTLQIGIIATLLNIFWVATQLPIGIFIDKYGSRTIMLAAQAIGIFTVAGWLVSTKFEVFAIFAISFGIFGAAWFPARLTLFVNSVSPTERGAAIGRLLLFEAMGGFPAPFIGGLLFDHFGFWAPISANLFGVLITLTLIIFIREPR